MNKQFRKLSNIIKKIADSFDNSNLLTILAGITIFLTLYSYVLEPYKSKKTKHYQLWQVVNLPEGKGGSWGRIDALQELNKDGISLSGVDLSGASLQYIDLNKANLFKANFQEADLLEATLMEANLEEANLENAFLQEAKFQGANLKGAIFKRAELPKANLRGADLKDANLLKSHLYDADLRKADLRRVRVNIENLLEVKTLYEAKLDKEILETIRKEKPELLEPPN